MKELKIKNGSAEHIFTDKGEKVVLSIIDGFDGLLRKSENMSHDVAKVKIKRLLNNPCNKDAKVVKGNVEKWLKV